jgi:hypothetical protein
VSRAPSIEQNQPSEAGESLQAFRDMWKIPDVIDVGSKARADQ